MKKCVISILLLFSVRICTTTLTLISSDNHKIKIPLFVAQLSNTIQNVLNISTTTESKNRTIAFRFIKGHILKDIIDTLMLKHRIDIENIAISHTNIAAIILDNKKINDVKNYLIAADFLDIPFLVNVAAKKLVSLQLDEGYIINYEKFSSRINAYLKKHYALWMCNIKQELSIEQYINDVFIEKTKSEIINTLQKRHFCNHYVRDHFCLCNKKLTSLRGIEKLADNSVTSLYLRDNHILDRSCDLQSPLSPFFGFTNVKELYLDNNNLHAIDAHMLRGLYNLTKLILDFNKIDTIEECAFYDLTSLQKLSLYKNNIHTFPVTLFTRLSNLTELDLSFNDITHIPKTLFSPLFNLVRLHLQHNKLRILDDNLFLPFKKLKNLTIYNNELTVCSDAIIKTLHNLDQLDISKNRFDQRSKERLIMLDHKYRVKVML